MIDWAWIRGVEEHIRQLWGRVVGIERRLDEAERAGRVV